ncbi:hypothetical protein WJX72_011385 [[Myrmecia] bisecta]|uniref:Fibronectin type-III domain-containing protein n=1 Tax=[Myrmecia] bisecta TaxID=41462 RepID=A0AAW1QST5_9CHLO
MNTAKKVVIGVTEQAAPSVIAGQARVSDLSVPAADGDRDGVPIPPPPVPQFTPAQPPSLITVDTHSVRLQWPAVSQLLGQEGDQCFYPPCGMSYSLEMAQVEAVDTGISQKWSCCFKGDSTSAQVPGLRPGRRYAFRVTVVPLVTPPWAPAGPQPPSFPPLIVDTPPTAPTPPHAPHLAGKSRTTLTFKWREPDETGGRPILAYHLEMCPVPLGMRREGCEEETGFSELYHGLDLRFKVTKLQNGTRYTARVKAVNEIGESGWSEEAAFATQASVPAAPDPPRLVAASPASITLRWSEPADNGCPISAYRLERSDSQRGDFVCIYNGPGLEFLTEGLQAGFTYRFRLAAINDEGSSPMSCAVEACTAAVPPRAPAAPRLVACNRTSCTIAWQAPNDDGGAAVSGYQAEMQPKSKAALTGMPAEWLLVYEGTATAHTLGGLRSGCTYRVRVRACNEAGYGPYSVGADVATSADVPDPPPTPVPLIGSPTRLVLQWRQPIYDGGSEITGYRLEYCRVGRVEDVGGYRAGEARQDHKGKQALQLHFVPTLLPHSGLSCQAQLEELDAATEYAFRLSAINSQGTSRPSEEGRACTNAAVPAAPAPPHLAAPPSSHSLRLQWEPPDSPGARLLAYTLQLAQLDAAMLQPATASGQCGSENGGDVGANGVVAGQLAPGAASATSNGNIHQDGSTSRDDDIRASRPIAAAMADSDVQRMLAFSTAYHGPDTMCDIKGLEPFVEYLFRLRATNSMGNSDWSESVTWRTGAAVPTSPQCVVAQGASSSSVSVQWREPGKDQGAPVVRYQLEYCSASSLARGSPAWQKGYSGHATACQVGGLQCGREYRFRVCAINSKGQGAWSASAAADTLADVPGAPDAPTCSQRTATTARLKWAPPQDDNGAPVLQYRLDMAAAGGEFAPVFVGPTATLRVQKLQPGTSYHFRVQAINAVGNGAWSAAAQMSTAMAPPPPPAFEVTATPASEAAPRAGLTLHWAPPSASVQHADCASYEVELQQLADNQAVVAPLKLTCPGKATECLINSLLPGVSYQVRMRESGAAPPDMGGTKQRGPRRSAARSLDEAPAAVKAHRVGMKLLELKWFGPLSAASKQKEVAGAVPGQAASRVAPQPSTSSAAASPQAMTSGVAEAEGQAIPGSSGASDEEEDDGLRELAWKWRQRRRWQQEQAKQFDPSYGAEGDDDDGWDAALGYLDACGPGWHLQIARTTSVDKNLGYSLVSHGSDLSTLLLEESQREGTLREHADMDATRSLVSVARKARDLYEQQQQIEKQVEQRWCHAGRQEGADSWVGAHLQSVQIDASGKFTFILMKVWDRQGRNRLLIRGKAQSSEGQLVQRVSHEVMQVIAEQRLPNVMVTLLGSGIMEWSRERDRRLDVYQGRVVKGGDASIMSSMDVARLAGALTRASLPMHYHICVESVAVCG